MHHLDINGKPLPFGVRLMWDKMRDASADAVLNTPAQPVEEIEPVVEPETSRTTFPWLDSQLHARKHVTFKKIAKSQKVLSWNIPPRKVNTR